MLSLLSFVIDNCVIVSLVFLGKTTFPSKKKKAKKKIYFKKAFYRFKNVFVARWTIPSPFLPP